MDEDSTAPTPSVDIREASADRFIKVPIYLRNSFIFKHVPCYNLALDSAHRPIGDDDGFVEPSSNRGN